MPCSVVNGLDISQGGLSKLFWQYILRKHSVSFKIKQFQVSGSKFQGRENDT